MDTIVESVETFLKHSEKKVLALKGNWGVGKTFFWNKFIKGNIKNFNFKKYSYVSLFGMKTIEDVQSAIFYNSVDIKNDSQESKNITTNLKKIASLVKKVPQVNQFHAALSVLEKSLIGEYLICIDDLERKDSVLEMTSILGYCHDLSVRKKCKIVFIYNNDNLDNKDTLILNRYREKVFDLELIYEPNFIDNFNIVFKDFEYIDIVLDRLKLINVKNIRILKHIRWNIDYILSNCKESSTGVIHTLIFSIIISTYIHHEPSVPVSLKTLEYLFSYKNILDDEEKVLRKTIEMFGYQYFQAYERELNNYIADGVLNKEIFKKYINELNQIQCTEKYRSEYREAWSLFNNNFTIESEQVIKGFTDFLNLNLEKMTFNEINQMTDILMSLEYNPKDYIDFYIRMKIESSNLNELIFFKTKTEDKDLLKLISAKMSFLTIKKTLKDTIYQITKIHGWNPEDIDYLDNNSEEDYYEWISKETDEDLLPRIRSFLQLFPSRGEDTRYVSISSKMRNALIKLSHRNKIDMLRVNRFLNIEE